jgi:hypothetical protein
MLERVRPEQWSPTHKVEHSGGLNIVEQHADQLVNVFGALLAELDLSEAQMMMVPDLIEKHFAPLEHAGGDH